MLVWFLKGSVYKAFLSGGNHASAAGTSEFAFVFLPLYRDPLRNFNDIIDIRMKCILEFMCITAKGYLFSL